MSTPTITELRRKAYGLQDDGTLNEDVDPVPMSRLISFLVGEFVASFYYLWTMNLIFRQKP